MLRNALHFAIFLAGLAAALWIGAGYIGSHAVGATVAFVIAACYLAGGAELLRYRRATTLLAGALEDTDATRDFPAWLQRLPVELRSAVRLRVEGERVALPAPALTPYLVGLLVLLGMLGTLLGMMATLRGTGIALESATDLQAIRGSLASPVEGLAVAFGTSIAGVATSAMLGLLSSLLRRERLAVAQVLDARVATDLRPHTQGWQRAETLRLLQLQSEAMPALIDRLQALVEGVQQSATSSHTQLDARQAAFNAHAETMHERLATSLEATLQRGVGTAAFALGTALEPMLRSALDGLDQQAARTQSMVGDAVRQQLEGLQAGFEHAGASARSAWDAALAAQQEANARLVESLRTSLDTFVDTQQRSATTLVDTLGERLLANGNDLADHWHAATGAQQLAHRELTQQNDQAWRAALDAHERQVESLLLGMTASSERLHARIADGDAERVAGLRQAFADIAAQAGEQWQRDGEQAAQRQQQICEALEGAAARISEDARAQATTTVSEIGRLLEAAAEAPRAAAEVVAELRQRLSDSMVRDTAMLEERAQLLDTVGTLMETITLASSEQRTAVDGLIEGATALMQRAGERFAEQVDTRAASLDVATRQVADSSTQVAQLAHGLDGAVQSFAETSASLATHLQQLAGALDASLARSDEQLAYYVAQAREVVDLSLLSQKQVIEELQQLAASAGKA